MKRKMLRLDTVIVLAFFYWGDGMNSFETDICRAVFSVKFAIAVILQVTVLSSGGFGSTLYLMCIPLICTLPYACGWLEEYKHGFVKFSLSRATVKGYVLGKFLACGIAGGLAEVLGSWIYILTCGEEKITCEYSLIFLSAMLWASVAATLAAISNSKYIAYGGSFVIYYFLVILCERYWMGLYCLHPYEWIAPTHLWVFGTTGIVLMLAGLITAVGIIYYTVIKRRIERV